MQVGQTSPFVLSPSTTLRTGSGAERRSRRTNGKERETVHHCQVLSTRHSVDPRIFIEVAIKSKSLSNAQPFHDHEACTINKAEQMIPIHAEYAQSSLKISSTHLFEHGRFATEEGGCRAHSQTMSTRSFVPHSYQGDRL